MSYSNFIEAMLARVGRVPQPRELLLRLAREDVHELGDDAEHDLVRAAADREEAAVAIGLRRGVVPREAHAAPELEARSEEHTSELQSQSNLVCRLLLEKKKNKMKGLRPQTT